MSTDDTRRRVRAALRAQPEPERGFFGKLLHREKKVYPNLPSGKPIRFRPLQQLAWTGMAFLLGAGFIAGLYWLVLQQSYLPLIHLLGFHPHISGSLKLWWDNGMGGWIRSGVWYLYRHGVRDGGEPALWAMVGGILLGKAKVNAKRLPVWLVPFAALLLMALIVAGTLGITWLVHFGPLKSVNTTVATLLLGLLLGRLLHFIWMPVAVTIRYQIVSNSATKAPVPLWVRKPLMPPSWRDMWCELRAKYLASGMSLEERRDKRRQSKVVIPAVLFGFLFIAVVGNLAKYGVAHGADIPFMITPKG